MELETRLASLEKTVSRLEKLIDGNGDSLLSKFEKKLGQHLADSEPRLRAIEQQLGDMNAKIQLLNRDYNELSQDEKELLELFRERDASNNAFRTQLLVLLGTTLLNLILGAVKIFGGGG